MEIAKIQISQLNAADYNPRAELRAGSHEYESLKRSIEEFGYILPIAVNKNNNRVIGGHQRLNVLRAMGFQEADCVLVSLDETSEKLLNLSLNKIDNDWDYDKLLSILESFAEIEFDTSLTGFTQSEIESMFSDCPSDAFFDAENADNGDDAFSAGDKDDSKGLLCRIGEFSFEFTQAEWEAISGDIRLTAGFASDAFSNELKRRLLA